MREQLETRFPWGIPSLQPSRFVLVEHAEKLSIGDTSQLGDLGLVSALHLPLEDQGRHVGAMQLYWESRVEEWDDRCGALLRALGVFVLDRLAHTGARTPDAITDVPPERI